MFQAPTASAYWRRRHFFTRRRCPPSSGGRTSARSSTLHRGMPQIISPRRRCGFLSYGAAELRRAMIDAYQALGRPSLAAVVSRRIGRLR
jgi:hypothetical protein